MKDFNITNIEHQIRGITVELKRPMGRDMWIYRRDPEKTLAKRPLDNNMEYCPRCWEEFAVAIEDWRELRRKYNPGGKEWKIDKLKQYRKAMRENDSFYVHRVRNREDLEEIFCLCPACGTAFQDQDRQRRYNEPPLLYKILYLAVEGVK
mgnify:CR=1 FL=1